MNGTAEFGNQWLEVLLFRRLETVDSGEYAGVNT